MLACRIRGSAAPVILPKFDEFSAVVGLL